MRLFNLLLYASLTSRFAVLRTPRGMGELVRRGAMTQAEYTALLQTGMGHHAVLEWIANPNPDPKPDPSPNPNQVLEWIATLLNSALSDGRLCGSDSGGVAGLLQITLQKSLTELRASYGSIKDLLTGRMPLAYTQLVRCRPTYYLLLPTCYLLLSSHYSLEYVDLLTCPRCRSWRTFSSWPHPSRSSIRWAASAPSSAPAS